MKWILMPNEKEFGEDSKLRKSPLLNITLRETIYRSYDLISSKKSRFSPGSSVRSVREFVKHQSDTDVNRQVSSNKRGDCWQSPSVTQQSQDFTSSLVGELNGFENACLKIPLGKGSFSSLNII